MSEHVATITKAEDYTYLLPDHWLLNNRNIWSIMHEEYVRRVIDLVAESGAKTVVEIGCGDGWNCGQLVKRGFKTVGADWSKNGIDHAIRMVPDARFHCGDVTDIEFSKKFGRPFDAAILVEVIEHIRPDECAGALATIRDLLRPGGTLVLTTPSTNTPNTNPAHYRHFTEDMLRELIGGIDGLSIKNIEGYGDVKAERRHWRIARFVNNRHYTVHRAHKWLAERHRRHCRNSPMDRNHGFIVEIKAD